MAARDLCLNHAITTKTASVSKEGGGSKDPFSTAIVDAQSESQLDVPVQLRDLLQGGEALSSSDKLWLELELMTEPVTPAWSALPAFHREEGSSAPAMPPIQNLQRNDFNGQLHALVVKSACPESLSNLWILVCSTSVKNATSSNAKVSISYCRAVGDNVVVVGEQRIAVIILVRCPHPQLRACPVLHVSTCMLTTCLRIIRSKSVSLSSSLLHESRTRAWRVRAFQNSQPQAKCSNGKISQTFPCHCKVGLVLVALFPIAYE